METINSSFGNQDDNNVIFLATKMGVINMCFSNQNGPSTKYKEEKR